MKANKEKKLILDKNLSLTIIRLDTCDSTNDYLKSHIREMKGRFPILLIANKQTRGRGRGNRQWFSSSDKGLYASLALNLTRKINLNLLSLTCGIVVLETIKATSHKVFRLKWPNDIMVQNKKIAGILVENIIREKEIICICGIGINLNHDRDDFPPELKEKSISMKMITGDAPKGNILIPRLVKNFFKWFDNLEKGKESRIMDSVRKSNYFSKGDRISIQLENGTISGSFIEIRPDGGISIEKDTGEIITCYTGKIDSGD